MHPTNYLSQDLNGIFIAFILFTFIFIFPGYVIGHTIDVFDFRKRQSFVQFGIALVLSTTICPIIFFLAYRLVSDIFAYVIVAVFTLLFVTIIIQVRGIQRFAKEIVNNKFARTGLIIALIWFVFSAFFLVDIQFRDRLYYNTVAYDYSTRVSVINAITRTGVPPVNPSYFPGSPQPLTQVYYFWYILCSMVDQIGGRIIDAHTALIASVIWTGLALASAIALFTRLRNVNKDKQTIWQNTFLGIGLLLVSGLDIVPASLFALFPKFLAGRHFEGDIEQWNDQITAWMGAITWTPHHVIGLLACLLVWMLIASDKTGNWSRQIGISLIVGLALASAFGLSLWIVLIFLVCWGFWFMYRLTSGESIHKLWIMILPGIFMFIALLPFLVDLFGGGKSNSATGQIPLAFGVRTFYPLEFVGITVPTMERMFIYLLALPLNYFIELGFFFLVGIIWLQNCHNDNKANNPLVTIEVILFLVTVFMVTFIRSTVIVNNDFGWRGWMIGQYILVLWGTDVIRLAWNKGYTSKITIIQTQWEVKRTRRLLSILIILGGITTFADLFLLRAWPMLIDTGIAGFPRVLSPDNQLGERTYAMREAYVYIEANTSPSTIVQFDPRHTIDRPAGLYRTRGTTISYHSLYGVPKEIYDPLIASVGDIFDDQNPNWISLDNACKNYHINVMILRDLDPIWAGLHQLKSTRTPLFENRFTALFECGDGLQK